MLRNVIAGTQGQEVSMRDIEVLLSVSDSDSEKRSAEWENFNGNTWFVIILASHNSYVKSPSDYKFGCLNMLTSQLAVNISSSVIMLASLLAYVIVKQVNETMLTIN